MKIIEIWAYLPISIASLSWIFKEVDVFPSSGAVVHLPKDAVWIPVVLLMDQLQIVLAPPAMAGTGMGLE